MSSKIGISAGEILTAIKALPEAPGIASGQNTLEAAVNALAGRRKEANINRVLVYRYDNGLSAEDDMFQVSLQAGKLPVHDVCRELDCDVQLVELGQGASTREDNARAAAFGMMAAEQDTGLIVTAGFGAGSADRARNIDPDRFFDTATPEVAAMMGAMVAAARAGIPVIAEGRQGLMAARALKTIRPDFCPYVFICGVAENDPAFHVFADMEQSHTVYAGVMLAALITNAYAKSWKAA